MKTKQHVVSDSVVRKELRKIQRKKLRDAKRQARKGRLNGVSLELYLGGLGGEYEQLKARLATGHGNGLMQLKHVKADLVGQAENLLNTLGNDSHRLQQAYATAQGRAKEAEFADEKLMPRDKITIGPLKKRLEDIKNSGLEGEDK